jgi:hypothetical protein
VLAELNCSEQVLQWFPLAASPNEFTKRSEFRFGKGTLELEIELDSFLA